METKRLQELANVIKEDRDLFGEFDKSTENVKRILHDMLGMHLNQLQYRNCIKMIDNLSNYVNNV